MKQVAIPLKEGQRFAEAIPEIPSNSIINKKVTGCGATYSEIKAHRHSIIIEPNVPVIKTKCRKEEHKDDNLFGIYEGITDRQAKDYIQKTLEEKKHVKILSTPESFWKIKKAADGLGINLYDTCFLLFDECQKIVKDVDYREDIALPIEDFFRFGGKALVSATPIYMSDTRFKDFTYIEIQPECSIAKPAWLFPTNNVLESLKRTLEWLGDSPDPVCLFLNSTDMIFAMMQSLGIMENSAVFCAPKSVERLNYKGFEKAFEDFEPEKMEKFNFFTSRFFCALDIELGCQPHVIAISDIKRYAHTALNPETDLWQIIGRFRKGIKKVVHIYTTDKNLHKNSYEDLHEQITKLEGFYEGCLLEYENATNRNTRIALGEILKTHPFRKFISSNGEDLGEHKDYFKIDNYVDENITLSIYRTSAKVKQAYDESGLFFGTEITNGFYKEKKIFPKLTIPSKVKTIKEKREYIISQLEMADTWENAKFKKIWRDKLFQTDPFIVEAYETIGKEKIKELGFSQQKIREEIILTTFQSKRTGTAFIELVKNAFQPGRKYKVADIKNKILEIYKKLSIPMLRAVTANSIKEFFEVSDTWMGKKDKRARAFYIIRAKI